jgi:hypothetical protein
MGVIMNWLSVKKWKFLFHLYVEFFLYQRQTFYWLDYYKHGGSLLRNMNSSIFHSSRAVGFTPVFIKFIFFIWVGSVLVIFLYFVLFCPFLIAPSVFSNIYFHNDTGWKCYKNVHLSNLAYIGRWMWKKFSAHDPFLV